jgi:hypothetical protein
MVRPPRPWPYATLACWQEWRRDLDTRVRAPNLADLSRGAVRRVRMIRRSSRRNSA